MTDAIVPPNVICTQLGAIAGFDSVDATSRMTHNRCTFLIQFGEIETSRVAVGICSEGVEGKVGGHLGEFARS